MSLNVHNNGRLHNWASLIEENTLRQAIQTSTMPFINPYVALMPDAHLGMGATVGSVIPTDHAIIPAAVGVDIGCGMIALRTQFMHEDLLRGRGPRPLLPMRQQIERLIPLSAGKYNEQVWPDAEPYITNLEDTPGASFADEIDGKTDWRLQLGTLGSGNHFIEVTVDEHQRVWLFLHSGSRGVGNKIAMHHIAVAKMVNKAYYIDLPDPDLAYLAEGTEEFDHYIRDLQWAQQFALLNRQLMMDRVLLAFENYMDAAVEPTDEINCHHNYTTKENHFGKNLWVSRKGAIDAHNGVRGLIPGSMGAASYVVMGRGNKESLCSSPHGAGRPFSRAEARRRFDLESLSDRMEGIEWSGSSAFIDEHPDAYKDIDIVMADSADLVIVQYTLHQILNVKGD
jgi:tRNA-splicing ligase RtcB (3'-phosphate/5'-hydroxy nucleic acid ligase)